MHRNDLEQALLAWYEGQGQEDHKKGTTIRFLVLGGWDDAMPVVEEPQIFVLVEWDDDASDPLMLSDGVDNFWEWMLESPVTTLGYQLADDVWKGLAFHEQERRIIARYVKQQG